MMFHAGCLYSVSAALSPPLGLIVVVVLASLRLRLYEYADGEGMEIVRNRNEAGVASCNIVLASIRVIFSLPISFMEVS